MIPDLPSHHAGPPVTLRRVLIADDHAVTRRGLRELLRDSFPGVQVEEVADGAAALRRATEGGWDLIMLDIIMPGPPVLDVIGGIRAGLPEAKILVFTAATEPEYVLQTVKQGANGVIHKHRAAEELVGAVRAVLASATYLHPEAAISIAHALRREAVALPHAALSARELEVFRRIALGRVVKEIAADLGLSEKTVATYVRRIRDKTGLSTSADIARYAVRHGLVS